MTTYSIILTVMIVWSIFGALATIGSDTMSGAGKVLATILNVLFVLGLFYIGGVL